MPSDSALVQEVLAGKIESFRRLVERYQDAVFGVALSKTKSFADAEDLAQETFLAAFESLERLKNPERFGSWLYGIALNKVKMHLRSATQQDKMHSSALGRFQERTLAADELVAEEETRTAVIAALACLSDVHREAATLYYINGYSQGDISRFTNSPLGTIKRRLHEARQRLRKELIAMVDRELKRARPGREFTERVVHKINQVRVWLTSEGHGVLLLTDAKKRSFPILIGVSETRALEPWLSGAGSLAELDIHTSLVRMLNEFGCRIKKVSVTELKGGTFYATLRVQTDRRVVEVDCRPSDGINFAVRAGAPIFVTKDVMDECVLKRRDGKPMSPAGAWRLTRTQGMPRKLLRFRNLEAVFRALERDPKSSEARLALCTALPGFQMKPTRVREAGAGMDKLEAWVQKCKGTKLEGIASGLVGAVYLWPVREPEKSIPYMEIAHRLLPQDSAVAFDLATAYAMAGRRDETLTILKKLDEGRLSLARRCGNFIRLWQDPRYRRLVGEAEPSGKTYFWVAQLNIGIDLPEHEVKSSARKTKAPRKYSLRRTRKMAQSRMNQLMQWLNRGPLLRIETVSRLLSKDGDKQLLLLEVEQDRAAAWSLKSSQRGLVDAGFLVKPPRPMTPNTVHNILNSAGIKLEAAVLLRRRRRGIEGTLVARNDGQRRTVSVEGAAALSIAAAKCPLLITESLAEKLYLRGKAGKPRAPGSAERKLRPNWASPPPASGGIRVRRMVSVSARRPLPHQR